MKKSERKAIMLVCLGLFYGILLTLLFVKLSDSRQPKTITYEDLFEDVDNSPYLAKTYYYANKTYQTIRLLERDCINDKIYLGMNCSETFHISEEQ